MAQMLDLCLKLDHSSQKPMHSYSPPKMGLSWPHIPCLFWNPVNKLVSHKKFISVFPSRENPWNISDVNTICTGCDMSKSFVFYLCIAFGILFLVMLLVNVYLCCAVTGNSGCFPNPHQEKSGGKSYDNKRGGGKPEEFDPYARSWHGSQYGSRWFSVLNFLSSFFLTH